MHSQHNDRCPMGLLEYHWCTTSKRMRWFLCLPDSALDHTFMGDSKPEALECVREINRYRVGCGLPNIYVAGV